MAAESHQQPNRLKQTPFSETLIAVILIASHTIAAPKPILASDALFVEGMTLSIVGATIASRISDTIRFPSFSRQTRSDPPAHTSPDKRRSQILSKRNGRRMLLLGLILLVASIVIGELTRPR